MQSPASAFFAVCIGLLAPPADAPSAQLLKLIGDLSKQQPFTLESVSRLTRHTLRRSSDRSNPFFEIYESTQGSLPLLSSVELRIPPPHAPNPAGLLLLSLAPRQCIATPAVRAHYNREPDDLRPSNPANPRRSYTLTYKFHWGEAKFQFASDTDCLTLVALDQIEAVPARK